MSTERKHKTISKKKTAIAIVDNTVGNYEKHPFFIKKANAAKTLLKAVGLPKELVREK